MLVRYPRQLMMVVLWHFNLTKFRSFCRRRVIVLKTAMPSKNNCQRKAAKKSRGLKN